MFSDEMVLNAWERMEDACTILRDRPPEVRAVPDDVDDDRVVACAVAAGVDTIISGDRHLLKLGTFQGIRIVRVSDFLTVE
jgi:predicted nucleic acid-binding protein